MELGDYAARAFVIGLVQACVLVVLVGVIGATSCVRRDWAFEDGCRKAGGVLARVEGNEACTKAQSPIIEVIPLPGLAR